MQNDESTPNKDSRLVACLRLARTPKIGVKIFKKLIELYTSPEIAIDAVENGECLGITKTFSEKEAQIEIEQCQNIGAKMVCMFDEEYPQMLLHIHDPPPVITTIGNISLLGNDHPKMAIVGSRNASVNGKHIAYQMAHGLSSAGFVIVSGLARGIDAAAHSIIFKKRPTIAVVANGINIIYPYENSKLYRATVDDGGLIISELPFSSIPKSGFFPQRNRIISGMSQGVVVVEASRVSGSLITANLALSQGRDVFAVPGSPLDERCSGSNDLIKQGATLVEKVEDILRELAFLNQTTTHVGTEAPSMKKCGTKAKTFDLVLKHLSASPTNIDELISYSSISADVLLASLMELELMGHIERLPGNRVALVRKT